MKKLQHGWSLVAIIGLALLAAVAAAVVTALLMNISERKREAREPFVRLVEVDEDTTDPAQWGINWPKQYDSYQRTALATRTRFGGHGGSEALPEEKIERDPWLKRMFLGYAFSQVHEWIWKALPAGIMVRFAIDGAIYALATGATFAWLWPAAA